MERKPRQYLWYLALLMLVINLVATPFLPARVGMQLTTGGTLGNFVPKPLFIFAAPLLIAVLGLTADGKAGRSPLGALAAPVLIFLANLLIVFMNLRQ